MRLAYSRPVRLYLPAERMASLITCIAQHYILINFNEPTIGRVYDEENYQIGFVDIADTPYAETIAAAREVGRKFYR